MARHSPQRNQKMMLLSSLVLLFTSLSSALGKGRLTEAIDRRLGMKSLRARPDFEFIRKQMESQVGEGAASLMKTAASAHKNNAISATCGTPTHKQHARSHGKDQLERVYQNDPCLETICDDPAYVLGYLEELQKDHVEKVTAKVEVYSIGKDDFSDPYSDANKSAYHKAAFDTYFKDANLEFEFKDIVINSSYLWYGEIMPFNCPMEWIGDGIPDWDCLHTHNGFDGGDWLCNLTKSTCDPICTMKNLIYPSDETQACDCVCFNYTLCEDEMIGNGVCDDVCNVAPKNYDGGDCCLDSTLGACYDPSRPLFERSFADIKEIRNHAQSNFSTALYVYVGNLNNSYIYSASVFPWTIDFSLSENGGFVIDRNVWAYENVSLFDGELAAHEAGHSLGLWHTFHGVSELEGCDDVCFEAQYPVGGEGTMLKGDLCADTRPTPVNYECSDPEPCSSGVSSLDCQDCEGKSWVDTPTSNIMGFSIINENCLHHTFSPQQIGRMRCYYDLYYGGWDNSSLPGHIVLPPVVKRLSSSIHVMWSSPFNKGNAGQLSYILRRSPPFEGGDLVVNSTEYIDRQVEGGAKYGYMVKAINGAGHAPFFSRVQEVTAPEDDSGLSDGAIVGLVLGSVGLAAAIGAAAAFASKGTALKGAAELTALA